MGFLLGLGHRGDISLKEIRTLDHAVPLFQQRLVLIGRAAQLVLKIYVIRLAAAFIYNIVHSTVKICIYMTLLGRLQFV